MSYSLTHSALHVKGLKGNTKLVLATLADFANPETGACYPSHETLAYTTGLTSETVRSCVDDLVFLNLISRERNNRKDSFHYTFNIHDVSKSDNLRLKQHKSSKTTTHKADDPKNFGDENFGDKNLGDRNLGDKNLVPKNFGVNKVSIVTSKENKHVKSTNRQDNRPSVVIAPTQEQLEKLYREFGEDQECVAKMQEVATVCMETNWLGIGHPLDYIRGVGEKVRTEWDGFVARCDASEQMRREPAYA